MPSSLTNELKAAIANFTPEPVKAHVGTVLEVGDGVARLSGLGELRASETVEFADGTVGVALNLEEDTVGAVVLGSDRGIAEGQTVKASGQILSVPVGETLIGRVVNPLGVPSTAEAR